MCVLYATIATRADNKGCVPVQTLL